MFVFFNLRRFFQTVFGIVITEIGCVHHRINKGTASSFSGLILSSKKSKNAILTVVLLVMPRTNPEKGSSASLFMPQTTYLLPIVTLPKTVWKNLQRLKNTQILKIARNREKLQRLFKSAKIVATFSFFTNSGLFIERMLQSRTVVALSIQFMQPGEFRIGFMLRVGSSKNVVFSSHWENGNFKGGDARKILVPKYQGTVGMVHGCCCV